VSERRAVSIYRALLRLYPRSFRDEYGPDMALLFSHQLRDERALRVWARGVLDVAVTLPALHLETRMRRPSNTATPLAFAALGVAGVLLAVLGGSSRGMLALGLSVGVASGALSVLSWRHTRIIATAHPLTAQWWKFLAGGAGVLGAIVVGTTLSGAVSDGLWWPTMMITIAVALATLAAGLVLGVAHLTANRTHHAPS
jgi:hypothetical protein